METFLRIIYYVLCLFMIFVILVQGGAQGGVGATLGSGNSQGVFGAGGATSFLGKVTYVTALMLLVVALVLARMMGGTRSVGLSDRLGERLQEATQRVSESLVPAELEQVPAASVPSP